LDRSNISQSENVIHKTRGHRYTQDPMFLPRMGTAGFTQKIGNHGKVEPVPKKEVGNRLEKGSSI
jgi:hypothetical protein